MRPTILAVATDTSITAHLDDADDDVGRLTIQNLCNFMTSIISKVEANSDRALFVGGVVTDNCANVVGMSESVGRFPLRCAAHGIALIEAALHEKLALNTWFNIATTWHTNNKAGIASLDLPKIRAYNETRWNSRLHFVEDVVRASNKLDTMAVNERNGVPILTQANERSLDAFVRILKPYETATLMVEGPKADMINSIEAFSVLVAHQEKEVEITNAAATAVFAAFRVNYLSPPLVIVAAMCPSWQVDESNTAVFEHVATWMKSAAAKAWCHGFGYPLDTLSKEFATYGAMPKTIVNSYSRDDFTQHLRAIDADVPALSKFVSHIARFTASEAECERVFSVIKKTVPVDRISLGNDSVENIVKLRAFARNMTPADTATLELGATDDDEEDEQVRRTNFANAVVTIMEQAAQRLDEEEEKRKKKKEKKAASACHKCHCTFASHSDETRVDGFFCGASMPWPTIQSANCACVTSTAAACATSLPLRSTATRVDTRSTSASLWLIKIMERPCDTIRPSVSNSASLSCGVSTAVGSSRIRMRAPRYSALRISTRWRSPTVNVPTRASGVTDRPKRFAAASSFCRAASRRENGCQSGSEPSSTLSSTLRLSASVKC